MSDGDPEGECDDICDDNEDENVMAVMVIRM